MNRQESRNRAKQRRAKVVARRKMILLLTTVLLITIGSIVFGSIFSSAQSSAEESGIQYKYYKSIEIKKGDSLWSIANEYCEDEYYDNTKDYVKELKEINNLKSEKIHYGQRLIVAYYDSEFK